MSNDNPFGSLISANLDEPLVPQGSQPSAAPRSGGQGDDDLVSMAEAHGAPLDVVLGLRATEGSSATAVSPKNARGELQVTPAAWKDYGVPGVSFDKATPSQLNEAGVKKIAADYQWAGGDPLKTAAAYQGGRGGATLWANGQGSQRSDGNLNIDQYVQRFASKVQGLGGIVQQIRDQRAANLAASQPQYDIDRRNPETEYLTRAGVRKGDKPERGFLGNSWDMLKGGMAQTGDALKASRFMVDGGGADSLAGDLANQAKDGENKPDEYYEAANAFKPAAALWSQGDYGKAALSFVGAMGEQIITNPKGTAYFNIEQLPNMLSQLGGAFAGAKVGAAAGSVVGPAGAAVGGVVGGIAGGFAGQTPTEVGSEFVQLVQQRAQELGKDPTDPQTYREILADKDFLEKAKSQALVKGTTTAAIDNTFLPVAGRIVTAPERQAIRQAAKELGIAAPKTAEEAKAIAERSEQLLAARSRASKAGYMAGAAGLDMVGGGASEAGGEYAAYGKVDPEQVMQEMFGELGGSLPHAALEGKALYRKPTPAPEIPVNSPLSRAAAAGGATPGEMPGAAANAAAATPEAGQPDAGAAAPIDAAADAAAAPAATDAPQAAQASPFAGTPHEELLADVTAKVTDRAFMQGLSPNERDELLYAYNLAHNPNVRADIRAQAVNDSWDFVNRKASGMGRQVVPTDAGQQAGQGTSSQSTGAVVPVRQAAAQTDPNVIDGHARLRPVQPNMREYSSPAQSTLGFNPVKLPAPQNKEEQARYEQEYADLLKVDQIDQRLQTLQQQAQDLQAAAERERDNSDRLAEIQQAIEANRAEVSRQDRLRLLSDVLADPGVQNHAARFQAELRRAGYRDTGLSDEETAKIDRFDAIRDALNAPPEVEPSTPNELDPYREREPKADDVRPMQPAQTIAQRRARVRNAVNDGATTIEQRPTGAVLTNPATGVEHPLTPAETAIARTEIARAADAGAHEAATSPENSKAEPTDTQKQAGDYEKGHINFQGLSIAIENPKGSVRSGVNESGKPWSNTMANHYGYIEGTKGADGDEIDAFVGPDMVSRRVFIVDQVNPGTGQFDEHKVMLGFDSPEQAVAAYKSNYDADWQGMGGVTGMDMGQFKAWLTDGDHTKPVEEQKAPTALQADLAEKPTPRYFSAGDKRFKAMPEDRNAVPVPALSEALPGLTFHVHRDIDSKTNDEYSVTEDGSGNIMARGASPELAIAAAQSVIKKHGADRVRAVIAKATEQNIAADAAPRAEPAAEPAAAEVKPSTPAQNARDKQAARKAAVDYVRSRIADGATSIDQITPGLSNGRTFQIGAPLVKAGHMMVDAPNGHQFKLADLWKDAAPAEPAKPRKNAKQEPVTDDVRQFADAMRNAGLEMSGLDARDWWANVGDNGEIHVAMSTGEDGAHSYELTRFHNGPTAETVKADSLPEAVKQIERLRQAAIAQDAKPEAEWSKSEESELMRLLGHNGGVGIKETGSGFVAEANGQASIVKGQRAEGATKLAAMRALLEKLKADKAEYDRQNAEADQAAIKQETQASPDVAANSDIFAKNKVFTSDAVEAARSRLRRKLGTTFSGIDPEMLQDGITLAGAYIEAGIRKFSDYAKAVISDLGEGARPYLRSWYEGVRHYPGLDKTGMTPAALIDKMERAGTAAHVNATASDVTGESPKAARKRKTGKQPDAERTLRQDFGVSHIDGYTNTDEFTGQDTDYGVKGGVKDAFLRDARTYLKSVEGLLADRGYVTEPDRKGKPTQAISVNEAGPAVSGDVSLSMFNPELGRGVYVTIGGSSLRGVTPSSPSGVGVMARVTKPGDRFGGDMNRWMETDLSAGELADALHGFAEQASTRPAARVEKALNSENTAPKEGTNNDERTGAAGDPALDGVSAAENEGAGADGDAAVRGREGSGSRDAGDAGAEASRVPGSRGEGSGIEGVHPAAGGDVDGGRAAADRGGRAGDVSVVGRDEGSAAAGRQSERAVTPPAPSIPSTDFKINDELRLGEGGIIQKFNDNLAAIQTLKRVEAEGRRATAEEQATLARYVGWGGLQAAFPRADGTHAKGWDKRGRALKDLLTPAEYSAAASSTRNAHYTSRPVVDAVWRGVERLGVRGGITLEPSVGVGNFIGLVPEALRGSTHFVGVELDSLTGRMAQLLYPNSVIHAGVGFQELPVVSNQSYDLVIGNPPFGRESLYDANHKDLNGYSIHNYFFMKGLEGLRPNGVLAMVVSRYLMDAKDSAAREHMAKRARLLGAIRLPDSAFQENANTDVVTDIVFLQKLPEAEWGTADTSWTKTGEIADPLGGDPITVNRYFMQNPQMMLGRMERSGEMYQGDSATLKAFAGRDIRDDLASALDRLPEGVVRQQTGAEAATKQFADMRRAMDQRLDTREDGQFFHAADGGLVMVDRGEDGIPRAIEISPETPWSSSLVPDANGGYTRTTRVDGKTVTEHFRSDDEVPARLRLGEKKFARLSQMTNLRDMLRRQISLEQAGVDENEMEANRAAMKAAYDSFVREHGFLNADANVNLFASDPDAPLLAALELSYDPGVSAAKAKTSGMPQRDPSAKPAPILERRVIEPYRSPEKASSHKDALVISLAETGRVDIERMASLMDSSQADVIHALHESLDEPLIYQDPEAGTWEPREAYLSGQVKRKLRAAREAGLHKNVEALEKVQPEDIPATEIGVRLGSVWVPTEVYQDFIKHLLGDDVSPVVGFRKYDAKFFVTGLDKTNQTARATETWGTRRMPTESLLQALLNSQSTNVYDSVSDGKGGYKRVINEEATAEASAKAREIAAEFQDWVYADGARRDELARVYNDTYNTILNRQYDGSHLTLPGKVPDAVIQMRRHQKNAVWRGIQSRNTLLDHTVGAGKTFTAQAMAMELRRMGLARKPMATVPNHMVNQFAADMYRLYPGAKVLAAGKKDFERKNRRRLFGRIATGDWDLVVVPHSSFGFIDISPETAMEYLQQDINSVQQAIDAAREEEGKNARSVKDIERTKTALEERMKKLRDRPTDRMLSFEEMGIDHLFVDEAQEFKNLFYHTRLQNVLGLGDKEGSKRALNLYMKTRVLNDGKTGRGGITFMTGTPISNSIVEMYTLMRYLAQSQLSEAGIEHFDAWHKQFAEARTQMEMNEAGGLTEKTRMASFSNMPELMKMYYEFADAVTLDDIKRWYAEDNNGARFPVPAIEGGKRQNIVVKPTPMQEQILQQVVSDFNNLRNISDPRARNKARLRLMDRARKVALDARAVDPTLPGEAGGKLSEVVNNALELYHRWSGDKGTQLIFLDRSVPNSKSGQKILAEYDGLHEKLLKTSDEEERDALLEKLSAYDMTEIAALRDAGGGGWNAYSEMKRMLMQAGVPEHQIRFIQEANTDQQKQDIFDAVNAGDVRFLIGSSQRMGAGTNVQQRLVGLHHVDVTWRPSDIEQREGRIERQGNLLLAKYGPDHFHVAIRAYATERTYDAKMWSLVEAKMRFINSLRHFDGQREIHIEDEDSENMAEMAALASGDPTMLERVRLEAEVNKLSLLRRSFMRRKYSIDDQIRHAERAIASVPAKIESAAADAESGNAALRAAEEAADKRRVTVDGETFDNAQDALAAVSTLIESQQGDNPKARYTVHVNGKAMTNRDSITAEIWSSLGDHRAFQIHINGKEYIGRNDAGRALAEVANRLRRRGDGEYQEEKVGEYLGLPLSVFTEGRTYGIALEGKARSYSDYAVYPESGAANAQAFNSLFSNLIAEVTSGASKLRRELANAERDLPDLKAQADKEFPHEADFNAKSARLDEVTKILAAKTGEPVAASAAEKVGDVGVADAGAAFLSSAANLPPNGKVGVTPSDARKTLARTLRTFPEHLRAMFKPVDTFAELPAEIQEDYRRRHGDDTSNAKAVHVGDSIYIVGENHTSTADYEESILHELIGHAGLRALFGDQWTAELNRVFDEFDGIDGMDAIAKRHGFGDAMFEYGSAIAKKRTRDGSPIDPRVARALLAEEFMAHLAQHSQTLKGRLLALLGKFRQWLRRHGFRLAEGSEADLFATLAEARANLQDSPGPAGGPGRGKRDPSYRTDDSPAFRSAAAGGLNSDAARQALRERIGDLFNTQRTFGWWHKSVGTQYHKAQIDPNGFGKVFNLAQKYIDDVARYASEAADKATGLLPKMETARDAVKGLFSIRQDSADAKAISAPIFEGTLNDKVWTDEELRSKYGLSDTQIGLYREFRQAVDKSLDDLAKSEMGRLARASGIPVAPAEMTMREAAEFYHEHFGADLEAARTGLAELKKGHAAERAMLEQAAQDEAGGADERKRFARLQSEMDARHAEQLKEAQSRVDELEQLRAGFLDKADKIDSLKKSGYAPLTRFGRYTVDVFMSDKDGNPIKNAAGEEIRPFFGMFETQAEANRAARALQEEYPAFTVKQGVMSQNSHQLYRGVTPETLEVLAHAMNADQDEAFQKYLKTAVSNRSALKRLIERKGIRGFSEDPVRVLASFLTSNARAASANDNMGDMLKAASSISRDKGDVRDEAANLIGYLQNPAEEASKLRGLLFVQFLGGSVASALVNMTQTFTMTYPYLHQFGGRTALIVGDAMRLASKLMVNKNAVVGDDALRAALTRAADEGVTSPHEIHMLHAESNRASAFQNNRFTRNLTKLFGSFFSLAEQYNRDTAFIAAFKVAQARGLTGDEAYQFAKKAVTETQGLYSKANRPNWARGAVGATLFTFKQYSISYIEFLKRLPAKERAIALGILMLAAGLQGMPGGDDLDDMIDTLTESLGYSMGSRQAKREFLTKLFGKDAAGFIQYGISHGLPIDVAGRMSMGNLIPGTGLLKRSSSDKTRDVQEFFGPAAALGQNMLQAFEAVQKGGFTDPEAFADAGRQLLPKSLQDAYKGWDMLQSGVYKDTKGRRVADVSPLDAAIKAAGFQPAHLAEDSRLRQELNQQIGLNKAVQSQITERWAEGIAEKDPAKIADARAAVADWNAKNPDSPISVKFSGVQSRVRQMQLSADERLAKTAPAALRADVRSALAERDQPQANE